jgi:hypothetical protein
MYQVSMTTGAKVATSVNGGKKGKPHVFRVTGATVASIARALEILRAAVLLHTDLMYALAAGRRVTKEHKINNVTFTFLAPGRHAAMRYVHSLSSGHTSSYQVECEPPSSLRVREIERILEDDEFNEDESEKALWEQDAHVQPHTWHSRGSSGAQGEMQDFTPSSHASEASSTPPSSSPSSPRSMSVDSRDGSLNGTTAPPMWTTTANNVQEPTLRPPVLGFGLRSSIWSVGTSGEGMP